MSEIFDFKGVDSATSTSYLKPGQYILSVKSTKFEQPDGKNPFVNVTFANSEGGQVSEKFYITPKTFGRLQYLHEHWTGKKLEKAFTNLKDIGLYFEKLLTSQKVERRVLVGGQESEDGTKVYAGLPYSGFIIPANVPFEEFEFEKGTPRYNDVVRKAAKTRASASDEAILSDSAPTVGSDDATPWDE